MTAASKRSRRGNSRQQQQHHHQQQWQWLVSIFVHKNALSYRFFRVFLFACFRTIFFLRTELQKHCFHNVDVVWWSLSFTTFCFCNRLNGFLVDSFMAIWTESESQPQQQELRMNDILIFVFLALSIFGWDFVYLTFCHTSQNTIIIKRVVMCTGDRERRVLTINMLYLHSGGR